MHSRKVMATISIAITLLSFTFYFFDKTAGGAIPRSNVLKGGKQSAGGDTNILLLGLDSRRDNNGNDLPRKLLDLMHVGSSSSVGGYNTNTMILIHIPANGKNAVAISIPRDDYVAVAGWGMQKIKEAYGLAKYNSENALLKKGVANPLREKESRDAVNLVGFYDIATALGGIQVCLRHAVNDSQYSGAIFPAGLQTISGVQALEFVRQRHGLPNGDLDRTHRQQAFITGSLLTVAKKDVVIDSGWDVLGFLPQAKALTGGHITFHTLPIEGYALRNGQDVNIIDIPTVRKFVHDLFYPAPKIIGGMGGGFFVAIQSSVVPVIGVAIFTICTVGGQTASSMLVDYVGLSPSGKHRVTLIRAITAVITLASVTVAVWPQLQSATFKALNGRMNVIATRPLATTFVNFLMGFFVLTIALVVNLARGGSIGHLPHGPLVYLGGPIGVVFIAVSAYTVKHLGILNFILFSVTGQLIGALTLDWLAPTAHTKGRQ
eukprot:gene1178-1194_t